MLAKQQLGIRLKNSLSQIPSQRPSQRPSLSLRRHHKCHLHQMHSPPPLLSPQLQLLVISHIERLHLNLHEDTLPRLPNSLSHMHGPPPLLLPQLQLLVISCVKRLHLNLHNTLPRLPNSRMHVKLSQPKTGIPHLSENHIAPRKALHNNSMSYVFTTWLPLLVTWQPTIYFSHHLTLT